MVRPLQKRPGMLFVRILSLGLLVSALAPAAVDRAAVTKLLETTTSVEALVPKLPEELRSNFTFIYQSRSPHGGLGDEAQSAVDPLHPRVVLFSKDARVILAFTGNPAKPGYNVVEMATFDDAKASFVLSKHELGTASPSNGVANPAECLRCHGQDPRPFTDSYPLWPGFYGSVRDTFPKGSPELPLYRKFLKTTAKTGVYKSLQWIKGTTVPPYLDPKKYDPNTIEASLGEFKFLPNTRLGMALTELNRKRIQRKLKASKLYDRYKYGLLAAYLGCGTLPVSENEVDATYNALVVENTDRITRLGTKPVGPGAGDLNMMEIGFYGNVVQILYLANVLEIGHRDWSLALEDNSLSFFDGILSSIHEDKDFYLKEDFILEMLRDLAATEPAFRPYFRTYRAYEAQGLPFGERLDFASALAACPLLEKRHAEAGKPLPALPPETAQPSPRLPASSQLLLTKLGISESPFARCVSCHKGEGALFSGRKIPFESPSDLALVLGKKSASSDRTLREEILERVKPAAIGHMPPRGESLGEKEAQDLAKFLSAVAGA